MPHPPELQAQLMTMVAQGASDEEIQAAIQTFNKGPNPFLSGAIDQASKFGAGAVDVLGNQFGPLLDIIQQGPPDRSFLDRLGSSAYNTSVGLPIEAGKAIYGMGKEALGQAQKFPEDPAGALGGLSVLGAEAMLGAGKNPLSLPGMAMRGSKDAIRAGIEGLANQFSKLGPKAAQGEIMPNTALALRPRPFRQGPSPLADSPQLGPRPGSNRLGPAPEGPVPQGPSPLQGSPQLGAAPDPTGPISRGLRLPGGPTRNMGPGPGLPPQRQLPQGSPPPIRESIGGQLPPTQGPGQLPIGGAPQINLSQIPREALEAALAKARQIGSPKVQLLEAELAKRGPLPSQPPVQGGPGPKVPSPDRMPQRPTAPIDYDWLKTPKTPTPTNWIDDFNEWARSGPEPGKYFVHPEDAKLVKMYVERDPSILQRASFDRIIEIIQKDGPIPRTPTPSTPTPSTDDLIGRYLDDPIWELTGGNPRPWLKPDWPNDLKQYLSQKIPPEHMTLVENQIKDVIRKWPREATGNWDDILGLTEYGATGGKTTPNWSLSREELRNLPPHKSDFGRGGRNHLGFKPKWQDQFGRSVLEKK